MLPLWRLEHDWIHRNKTGQLDFLKKSVVYCKKIHIRSKSVSEISLHAIKNFFETSIEPKKLDQMRKIKPDVVLLRTSLGGIKSNVLGILSKHNDIMLKSSEIFFQQQQLEKAVREAFVWTRFGADFEEKVLILDSGRNFRLREKHVAHRKESWLHREADWIPDKASRDDLECAAHEMRQEVGDIQRRWTSYWSILFSAFSCERLTR